VTLTEVPPLDEARTIYYGLQVLGIHTPYVLKPDKLFVVRACCVPMDDWTGPMWMEAARIIALQREIFIAARRPDPLTFELISKMAGEAPVTQGLRDARDATPRPSEEQLAEVRQFAAELAGERKASAPLYDIDLTPELGFAIINISPRFFTDIETMPGYCEVDGQAQCWLSSELRDFIIANRLEVNPNVLPAIVTEIAHFEKLGPWALALEKASTCSDPINYPCQLVSMLQTMSVRGIQWLTE
jgi:hypothetical protein